MARAALRAAVTAFQASRRAVWFVTRPVALGAHAIPITESGEVVLVRLTYAQGWRLPGGGLRRGEDPQATVLRELREEIGLTRHSALTHLGEFRHEPDYRRGLAQVYVVHGTVYDPPRWSLEIEEVRAFPPDALPVDLPDVTIVQLAMAGLRPGT